MSGRGPVNPKRREIEIIRVLFDRRLEDRAVALAESRWPGSGEVVRLAYEWAELDPGQRRERISAIGPDELARLRSLTALHPELQATVDELDRRGVLPGLEQAAVAGAASLAGAGLQTDLPPEAEMIVDDVSGDGEALDAPPPSVDAPAADAEIVDVATDVTSDPIPEPPEDLPEELKVDMPDLDIGLPNTEDFLNEELQRRAEAAEQTEAAMARVRDRLDQAASRTMSRSFPTVPTLSMPSPLADLPNLTAGTQESPSAPDHLDDSNLIEAPERIINAFGKSPVVSLAAPDEAPSDDELVAIANELGLGLREFTLEPGRTREVFGGLRRRGSQITTEAGPLPSALAARNLVVIYGRMHPSLVDRLQDGFADIPGTRATVKVHPDARALLIPSR